MILSFADDRDPERIADSGQCFHWVKIKPSTYRIIAGSRCLVLTALDETRYELEGDFRRLLEGLSGSGRELRRICTRIDPMSDSFLSLAAERERGIRILRQDPWEMLITFTISQNRNIPAIRRSVEPLAEQFGEEREDNTCRADRASGCGGEGGKLCFTLRASSSERLPAGYLGKSRACPEASEGLPL